MPIISNRLCTLLVVVLVAACTPPLVGELNDAQNRRAYDEIVARQADVAALCRQGGDECAQAQAILGQACYARARDAVGSARVEGLDCAVGNLGGALDHGLPATVGAEATAAYRLTYMEAVNDRVDLTASFAEGAPYTKALAAEAARFEQDYPDDWHGYYFAGQAALQSYNADLLDRPDAACAALGEAETAFQAADARSGDPRIDQALFSTDVAAETCAADG